MGAALAAAPAFGQNSDFNLDVHAHAHSTAKDIGLPDYPGATPFKEEKSDSGSVDLGFLLNAFHVSIKAVSLETADAPAQVLAFYRKPLARYGEVLECDHGKPVGGLKMTRSGLTCGERKSGGMTVEGDDSDHELRAGTPEKFHIVGIKGTDHGKTQFGLVDLVLPKDDGAK